jgi:hypothetical protein
MSMMFDTPDGVAFVKACARKGALSLEIQGMKRSSGRQTAYSIVKEVYGFRGNRQSVLEDLTEYIEAEIRLKHLPDPLYKGVAEETQRLIDWLTEREQLDQPHFESVIAQNEAAGNMTSSGRR